MHKASFQNYAGLKEELSKHFAASFKSLLSLCKSCFGIWLQPFVSFFGLCFMNEIAAIKKLMASLTALHNPLFALLLLCTRYSNHCLINKYLFTFDYTSRHCVLTPSYTTHIGQPWLANSQKIYVHIYL